MNKKYLFTLFNLVSYSFLLITSTLVNGATAFSVPDARPLITPAGYAFLIWVLIYVLLGIWIIKFGLKSTPYDEGYMKVSRFLPISLLCAGGSLLVRQPFASLFIVGAFISAMGSYVSCQHAKKTSSFFRAPFSIYLGWLSIATILELSIVLKAAGFANLFGLPEVFWAVFILMFAGFIAIVFNISQNDFLYPLVFIWAYIAIGIKNLDQPVIFTICCGVILLIGWMLDRNKNLSSK